MSLDNKYVKEFLKIVCREVHIKSIHKDINEELAAHIEDQKDFYVKQGYNEEAAFIESVKQMGDPVLIGKQLDMTHRIKTEWSILLITGFLVVIATIVQYFLSVAGSGSYDNFLRFLLYLPLGIAAFSILYFLDYTILQRYSKISYFAILTVTIIFLIFMKPINGVHNLAYYYYLVITPILAGVICDFRNKGYLGIIYSGLFCAGAALPCILAWSHSSLLFLSISCLIILTVTIKNGFLSGNKKVSLSIVYFPTLLMIIIQLLSLGNYRIQRLVTFFNPGLDPSGIGYLPFITKSLLTGAQPIGTTILEGNFAGKSIEKMLPEWNTGYSLTYIVAKFGYVFGIVIVVLLIIFLLRIFMSVPKQKNAYGFLLSFSVCIVIAAQIIFYILSNLGAITPVTVTLPFISYGATNFVLNMGLIGLLLSVYRRTDIVKHKLKCNESNRRLFTAEDGKFIIDLGVES